MHTFKNVLLFFSIRKCVVQQIKQHDFKEYVILPDFVRHHYQAIIANVVADANAPAVVVQFIKKSKKREINKALPNVTILLAQSPIWPVNIHSRRFFFFFF